MAHRCPLCWHPVPLGNSQRADRKQPAEAPFRPPPVRATSSRNGERNHLGTPSDIKSDWRATSSRIRGRLRPESAVYCARGEMENRIKECQLDLYADRTSAHTMRANQLRLWFASMSYLLICALRRIGLAHTQFARASCGTIRLKLLKIGALVRTSVRRIKLAMPTAFSYQAEYHAVHAALAAATA